MKALRLGAAGHPYPGVQDPRCTAQRQGPKGALPDAGDC